MTSATDTFSPRPTPSRDGQVIALIGSAHFSSHFFQMVLPPLFPLMKDALGVGYTELGLLMTVFYAVSGIGQPVAGFVVDKVGARVVLVGGIALLGASMILVSFAPSYWLILALMVPAGLGNCVFHPADYSILSASVSPGRMGRAFSIHAFGGTMGWALAPVAMLALAALVDWRFALAVAGVAGLVVALVVRAGSGMLREDRSGAAGAHGHGAAAAGPDAPGLTWQVLLSLPILMCFAYFLFLAVAGIALQNFLAPTLEALHGTPIAVGATALTAYLLGSAVGILFGGYTADRVQRHELMVGVGLAGAAVLVLVAGYVPLEALALNALLAAAGFLGGLASPARDMLVRRATPKGATGKVFGFVYSGLDLGSTTAPTLAGYLVDHGHPIGVLWLVAAGQLLAILTAFGLGRRPRRPVAQPAE
jgi:FSR family fosmidomycin resistance protein-like MFS transporter